MYVMYQIVNCIGFAAGPILLLYYKGRWSATVLSLRSREIRLGKLSFSLNCYWPNGVHQDQAEEGDGTFPRMSPHLSDV